MATRATIKIEGVDYVKIYKNFDGYPKGMTKWLSEFNDRFNQERGHDAEYKFAQLLRFSMRYGDQYDLDSNEFTGWGVAPYNSDCGEEYEYILTKDELLIKDIYEDRVSRLYTRGDYSEVKTNRGV
tara:strand:+ start:319 stop:696 length:378 start_codon:yes stop_codon:yes gene_type:complete